MKMAKSNSVNKNKNDLIIVTNLLAKFGYDVIAVRNDEQFNQALAITVFPPGKGNRK
jgi:hypothetical protein